MTRWLTLLTLALFAGLTAAAPVPKAKLPVRAKIEPLPKEKVCVAELFAQLDELLEPDNWVLARKTLSFSECPADAKLPRR
jgi:hypothetical protein